MRLSALAASLLLIAACNVSAQMVDDDPDWKEVEIPAPPAFRVDRLVELEMPRHISLKVGFDPETLRVPATTLVFDRNGTQVAQVGDDHRVALRPVTLGRNLGNEVEVRAGVSIAERLIDNPQEFLASGDVVRVAGEEATPRTASAN